MGQKKDAKIEFDNVIAIAPDTEYAFLAKQQKKKHQLFEPKNNQSSFVELNNPVKKSYSIKRKKPLRSSLKPKYILDDSDNYFYSALENGELIRFNADYPIYIYIPFEDYGYETRIHEAFSAWENAYKKFDFRYTLDKNKADIVFIFENIALSENENQNANYSGLACPVVKGNLLERVDIKIKTKGFNKHRRHSFRVFDVVAHEVGHALGIWGHSNNYKDMMYPAEDYNIKKSKLTERDRNTIRLLYENKPDITNKY